MECPRVVTARLVVPLVALGVSFTICSCEGRKAPSNATPNALADFKNGSEPSEGAPRLIPGAPEHSLRRAAARRAASEPIKLDGAFSAAAALIHLRGTGTNSIDGIAIVNGSDMVEEPVTLFQYTPSVSPDSLPDWKSVDYGFHSGVCVGDLDSNGFQDLIVTVLGNRSEESGVKAYYGTGSSKDHEQLSRAPVWLATGFGPTGCAVADVDGNGKADVIVTTVSEPSGPSDDTPAGPWTARRITNLLHNGTVRVVLNAGKPKNALDSAILIQAPPSPTCSGIGFSPSGVIVQDLDLDGLPDMVVAGSRLAIWFGKKQPAGGKQFTGTPDWYSADEFAYTPGLDIAFSPQLKRKLIAVSRGCTAPSQTCCNTNGYFVYDPLNPDQASPARKSPATAIWSDLLPVVKTPDGKEKKVFAGTIKFVAPVLDSAPDLIATIQYDGRNYDPVTCANGFGAGMRRYSSDPARILKQVPEDWHPEFNTVVSDLEFIHEFASSTCDSLLAVSALPFVQSQIFSDVANCRK